MKQKTIKTLNYILFSICIFMSSNFYVIKEITGLFWIFIAAYVLINIFPAFMLPRTKRLKNCAKGNALLIEFLGSTALCIILFILSFTTLLPFDNIFGNIKIWVVNMLFVILFETTVFWNGMLRVFFSSEHIGTKIGVKALICGLIPIVQIFVLNIIIKTIDDEIKTENNNVF